MTETSEFKPIRDNFTGSTYIPSKEVANDAATWGHSLFSTSAKLSTPSVSLKLLRRLGDYTGRFWSVAWSPDGKLLAAGSNDQAVELWDPTTGRLQHILGFGNRLGRILSVAWSPDGKLLAAGSDGEVVLLWNPTTRRLLHSLEGHLDRVLSVAWSPDGKLLASGSSDGRVRLWNPASGTLHRIMRNFVGGIYSVAWSPDGKLLAGGSDRWTIQLYNPTTGERKYTLEGHKDVVRSMAWSPNSKLLASGSDDKTVRLWDSTTGALRYTLEGCTTEICSVAWSPDGELLAAGSSTGYPLFESEVTIWRTDIWEPIAVLTGLKGNSFVAWHPHFTHVTTAGQGHEDIFVLRLEARQILPTVPPSEAVHYASAKVVLVGDSGVGKSGLALVLTGQPFAPTDSTHGRCVWLLDQQEMKQKDRPHEMREMWLWDLASQPDYRLIHQLHLHEATVALIVFDAARNTDPFAGIRHWHRALCQAQKARGSAALPLTIFLVAARIDRGGRSMSRTRINDLVLELGCAGYIETSAKDGRGIAELGQAIRSGIDWTNLPKVTSTTLLQTIKTFILSEQQAGRLLCTTYDLYDAFLHSFNAPTPSNELRQQFETALGRLEAQGSIHWLGFGDLVLLQPERLDAYASALLITVKDEPDDLGSIPEVRVQQGDFPVPQENRLPNLAQEKLLLIAMIDELVRHQLVLRESGFLLFPSQSTREHPERTVLEHKSIVTFTFAGPVFSIYTTLVVRLAQCGIFQKLDLWQHVVIYTTRLGGMYGLLLSPRGEERAELGLFFDETVHEEMRLHFENFVSAHIERCAEGTVQQRRRFICPECGKAFPEEDITYRKSRGFTFIKCVCDTEVSLSDGKQHLAASSLVHVREMELVADVERDRERAATIRQGKIVVQETNRLQLHSLATQQINIYISSASTLEDEALLDELEKQLSMVKRQRDVYLWEKRLISPGTNWEQEIFTNVNQAHLILFLMSPDFLASNRCYEEMKLATGRINAGEVCVIPLLMRHTADWQETPIGTLEPLPSDRKPVKDRVDRERAMRDIAEHIRQVVEKIRQDLAKRYL